MEINYNTILVTGGNGFIGSHLVEELIKRKKNVITTYRALNQKTYLFTSNMHKKAILYACDVRNFSQIHDIITRFNVDFVYHLAAQTLVQTAYYNPVETLTTNIEGTINLLEAVRVCSSVKGIIVASSDKAYGKSSKTYKESDPLKGDHPYEVSKTAADYITQMYIKTYNIPAIITRFGNVYGPGDMNESRLIPGIMDAILRDETFSVRSDGSFVRDYVFIKDVISSYIFLMKHFDRLRGKSYNISSAHSYSVIEVIKKVEKILRKKISYTICKSAMNEIPYQHLDITKIKEAGWRPIYSFENGIKATWKWYKHAYL